MENVIVGNAISATLNNGRYFAGEIVSVKSNSHGTLVIIRYTDANAIPVHKSFYMETVKSYSAFRIDQNPARMAYCEAYRDTVNMGA